MSVEEGRRLRDEGMALALTPILAEQYKDAYRREFNRLAKSGEQFCSEMIRDAVGDPPPGVSPNICGALFSSRLRAYGNLLAVVDRRPMERSRAHARKTDWYQMRTP